MALKEKQNACGFPYVFGQFAFLDMSIAFYTRQTGTQMQNVVFKHFGVSFFVKVI